MASDAQYGLSVKYFRSAVFSAREATRIEEAGKDRVVSDFYTRIKIANNEMGFAVGSQDPHWPEVALRTHVCGAILYCAGSIEARANHFFVNASERATHLKFLGEDVLRNLEAQWNLPEVRRGTSPLERIQLSLEVCGSEAFERGRNPFQDAGILFDLRNALVHFVPEWTSRQEDHARIEAALRSKRFKDNPFVASDAPSFPGKLLGADLAVWSVHTAYNLIAQFLERVGYVGGIRSWDRLEYYIRDFADWEPYARWEGGGGPPWTRD